MRTLAIALSLLGLALTVVPALLVFSGVLGWSQHAGAMLVGTILWFACAPWWLRADHGTHP